MDTLRVYSAGLEAKRAEREDEAKEVQSTNSSAQHVKTVDLLEREED